MRLREILSDEVIVESLRASDKRGVLKEIVELLKAKKRLADLSADKVLNALIEREKFGSTGIGKGIAVPHAKLDGIREIVGAFGKSPRGIEFNALDGEPVHIIFLVLSPPDRKDEYIKILQRISTAARKTNFCRFLRNAKSIQEIVDIFQEMDEIVQV